jgi:CrcB protein
MGTLAANLTGGLLIGITMGMLSHFESLPPEMRLLVVTGFLGAMTTFSTFSAETVSLVARQQWGWAAALIFAHLAGSLLMTLAGIGAARLLLR